ncbi:MAG: DnaB-like helicase C-terminal domain-containing protein [Planctomycetota bacterium]
MTEQTADLARQLIDGPQPTDTLPADAGPPWLTVAEVGRLPAYRKGLTPVTTGFSTLDRALRGGFRPESMYILAGRTGSAKTTLALNVTRRAALAGHSVLLFKLEESSIEAVWRLHAAASQVELVKLLDGLDGVKPATDDRQRLVDGWTLIRTLPIRLSEQRGIDAIERVAKLHVDDGGELVVVDQVSMVDCPGVVGPYERTTAVSNALRLLARKLHVPILLVAQINRPASKKEGRLTCNDLRDSGALENDAAAVLLIDRIRRPDVPRWNTDPCALEIVIGKNRYGRSTRENDAPLELLWWPWCARIEDAAKLSEGGTE